MSTSHKPGVLCPVLGLFIASLWLRAGPVDAVFMATPSVPTYYVSAQSGNDGWSGLQSSANSSNTDGPFRTLTRAQTAMRTSSLIKTTIVRSGTYSIAFPMTFAWNDDGERWIALPGEAPILDGAGTGGLSLAGATNMVFEGLTFQNLGSTGFAMGGGATSETIRWNNFYNCVTACISGGGVSNSIIDSNNISGQSPGNPQGNTANAYSAIMFWYGSSNNQITHNRITNCEGGAISFSDGPADPPNNNNIVDRNIIQDVDTNVFDQGAIYMADKSHSAVGNQITNNVIVGNGGSSYLTNWTKAIYIDDLMSNVTVTGNICQFCGQYAWQIHAGDHNLIANNIFDLSSPGTQLGLYQNNASFPDYRMTANILTQNVVYFSGAPPQSLYTIQLGPGDSLPSASRQLFYSATGAAIPNGPVLLDSSPVYSNPNLALPAALNYVMPSSSPAYSALKFAVLPTNQGPVPYAP